MTNHSLSEPLKELVKLGEEKWFSAGSTIIREGDSDSALYVLHEGRVRVLGLHDGGRELILDILEPGQIFGEMALDGGSRSATVMAVQNCRCAVISSRVVNAYMLEHPEFAVYMLMLLIGRARRATQKAKDMALSDVYSRLTKALTQLAGDAQTISPKVTHSTLAQIVGASREMVSKIMKDLEQGGYVQNMANRLVLLKRLPGKW